MLLLLYWIQNLIGANWVLFSFIAPVLKALVLVGKYIFDGSVSFCGANIEFKYISIIVLLMGLYYLLIFIKKTIILCEQVYGDGRRQVKKIHENVFNRKLEQNVINEQKKIDSYQIYVATEPKMTLVNKYVPIDISEENKKMNKFLISKTGVIPAVIRKGYIYSFRDFEQIDKTLDSFFELLKSESQVDYYICVYLTETDRDATQDSLEKLSELYIKNKIITLANLALRYKYNTENLYSLSILGVFQKDNGTFEVQQFVETK